MKLLKIIIVLFIYSNSFAVYTHLAGTTTIGTGMEYATISAFEAGLTGTLTGSVTGYINANYKDTTAVVFAGIKGASDKQVYIRVNPPFANTTGVWDGTKSSWTMTSATTLCQIIACDFLHIVGLQIELAANNNDTAIYNVGASTGVGESEVEISNCIIRLGAINSGTYNRGIRIDGGENNKIFNNIIYGFNLSSEYGISTNRALSGINAYIYNNTLSSCTVGIAKEQATPNFVLKNNISVGCADGYSGTWGAGSDYNASDIASDLPIATQTNSTNSATTAIYVNPAIYNFTLAGTDLWVTNKGTNLSTDSLVPFTTDISGTTRPQGSAWDMGAFEFPVAPVVNGFKPKTIHVYGSIID